MRFQSGPYLTSMPALYFPWGQEQTSTQNGTFKFAGYWRDAPDGSQDYADQRYYNATYGRFWTADPYEANNGGSADLKNPQSWNRYAYAIGDPINFTDPHGLKACVAFSEGTADPSEQDCGDGPSGGGDPSPPQVPHTPAPVATPGGSGTSGGSLTIDQITQMAEQQAIQWLQNNPNCRGLFGTGFDPAQVLASLETSGQFISGFHDITLSFFNFGINAVGGLTVPNPNAVLSALGGPILGLTLGSGASIAINTGAYSQYDPVASVADTIIEELGHAYNLTLGSGGSSIVYDGLLAPSYQYQGVTMDANTYNATIVMQNCNK
jgi:RHS repeat-associated protein